MPKLHWRFCRVLRQTHDGRSLGMMSLTSLPGKASPLVWTGARKLSLPNRCLISNGVAVVRETIAVRAMAENVKDLNECIAYTI